MGRDDTKSNLSLIFKNYTTSEFDSVLTETIYDWFTKKGDTILDPFCGSGSTLVACKKLNRKFIGFELVDEYIRVCEKRLYNVPMRIDEFIT